jgi:alpha,alpha-trehalose phosphorylase
VFGHPAFAVEPWSVTETTLDLDVLAQSESIFALSNGHVGVRGNLDEGEPHGLPGTYLNSLYELRPLPYAEAGYGYPESGQTVINITNGKLIRLLVDDEPFDVRYGDLHAHRRILDLRAGTLHREAEWQSPAGGRARITSTRLVSLTDRAVVAIRYEVRAVNNAIRVVIQSELVANEALPPATDDDPRVSSVLAEPLQGEEAHSWHTAAILMHRVKRSGLRLAAAMDHQIQGPDGTEIAGEASGDIARVTVISGLDPGQSLMLTKFVGYGWSAARSRSALHDQVRGAVQSAIHTGWEGLLEAQQKFLDAFWSAADVEIHGDPELQQAVRFSIFHVLQAGARAERRPIPAKGLTGPGYDGHAFWDTEVYVLSLLGFTRPASVADALRWRHATLPAARERARQLGLSGAAFPWRTINGAECSSYWPAGTAAFHIDADIAYAVIRYVRATGDLAFEAEIGVDLLVETARLWRALGHHNVDGSFGINGVTGPDEYSAIASNNVYTNLMAQLNLREAAAACARHPERAAQLGVGEEEPGSWLDAARDMRIPYDERLQVHAQAEGFTEYPMWDFAATREDQYPLLMHFPYFDLYRKQVVKQADLVLAMHLRGDAFKAEEKSRNFEYYERITVRDSSLSACTQAVLAAETGHLSLAYDYAVEAALMDLADIEHNTKDGLHMASLAGAWIALVEGLGGVRLEDSRLILRPCLPENIRRLRFTLIYQQRRLEVTVTSDRACYRLDAGAELDIWHYDEPIKLAPQKEHCRPLPALPPKAAPGQPPGREPFRKRLAGVAPIAPQGRESP